MYENKRIVSYDMAQFIHLKLNYPIFDNHNKVGYYNRRTKTYIYFGRTGNSSPEHLYGAPTKDVLKDWLRKVKNVFSTLQVVDIEDEQKTQIVSTIYDNDWRLLSSKIIGDTNDDYSKIEEESLWHLINYLRT